MWKESRMNKSGISDKIRKDSSLWEIMDDDSGDDYEWSRFGDGKTMSDVWTDVGVHIDRVDDDNHHIIE